MNGKDPGWEYARCGEYHRNLDPNWSYTPTYLKKMAFVRQVVSEMDPHGRLLDVGCGEGVLVEEFLGQGLDAIGLDLNYECDFVQRGSVLDLPFDDSTFDMVLLLDVFEHLNFDDQPQALREIMRVLLPGGRLVASIPNLAHWTSRAVFSLFGSLDRTDIESNHPGERPYPENRTLIERAGFEVEAIRGVTLSVPLIYRRVICRNPARYRWLHDLFEPFAVPSLSLLDIFVCRRPRSVG